MAILSEIPASRRIRVLGFPAFSNRISNSYNANFYNAAATHDVDVMEFSLWRAFFGRYDIIHIHWPERYLNSHYRLKAVGGSALLLTALGLCRLLGRRVVWTVHNLKAHNLRYPHLSSWFWKRYVRAVDATISLSKVNQTICLKERSLPAARHHAIIYHPLYEPYTAPDRENILEQLQFQVRQPYCLFVGRILPYKHVEILISLFRDNPPDDLNLIIAGSFEDHAYRTTIEALAAKVDRVHLIPRHISDQEMAALIDGCALGVLPFKEIFNSGSLLQFPAYRKPVLVPRSDNFSEYGKLFSISPFIFYDGELTREVMMNAIQQLPVVQENIPLELTWEEAGRKGAAFFHEIVQS
jgi:beta-1,4-mannosyltransferase